MLLALLVRAPSPLALFTLFFPRSLCASRAPVSHSLSQTHRLAPPVGTPLRTTSSNLLLRLPPFCH
eukprot:4995614-Pleurochrysis_carterae.AAC.1